MSDGIIIRKQDLETLLGSIRSQFITPYKDNIEAIHAISSTTKLVDSSPLIELSKLSKIIKAQSTKIGIIVQPEKIIESNLTAIYKEYKNLVESIFYLLSLLPLFYNDKHDTYAKFFLKKLDEPLLSLINALTLLVDETEINLKKEQNSNDTEVVDKNRLISIGMIWSVCDTLDDLSKKGNFGLLGDYIKSSSNLVDDVLNDIDEWFEAPELGNDDAFFLDDESDSEEEQEVKGDKDDKEKEDALERMKVFLKEWQTNLKMIKLLLTSFNKSISMDTHKSKENNAGMLDKFQELHLELGKKIDDFISDIFMSDSSFQAENFDDTIQLLNSDLTKMVSIIKKLSKNDAKKSKWIEVWDTKYFKK
ncbi:uncharacterized protein NDAI_0I01880 [Naumovozyma dairenensis CBS 421]|uniref:Uncharacterized protein n=1 Tax=Naumovozyma dairenensis (strain ATCC 10597 / BCRC 20456 / CBS 421 / NBRC 0211 / NRRL Y-12639) TaxID=1071378 RepID=G0WG46_NAUDC|nr:hypothetical protein NDAI_0I01880 [Naumovozyma dairenensis CBS 421]CCD26757.1 hypothetical protein NDAI_0I01880 [Naumovozyma dairenensis CBS 421]